MSLRFTTLSMDSEEPPEHVTLLTEEELQDVIDFRGANILPESERSGPHAEALAHPLALQTLADPMKRVEYNAADTQKMLHDLHALLVNPDVTPAGLREHAYRVWRMPPLVATTPQDLENMDKEFHRLLLQIYQLRFLLVKHRLIGDRTTCTQANNEKLNHIFLTAYLLKDYLVFERRLLSVMNPQCVNTLPKHLEMGFHYSMIPVNKLNDMSRLCLYVLSLALGLRKLNKDIYEQVVSPDGYETHAWKQLCTIEEFIHQKVQKDQHAEMWLTLFTKNNMVGHLAEHLEKHSESELPVLQVQRHVHAFTNGILVLGHFEYGPGQRERVYIPPAFHPYDTEPQPLDVTAVKYWDNQAFDVNLLSIENWYDIPTPAYQKLMDDQDWSQLECMANYIMTGRLQFQLHAHDQWQIVPVYYGKANTGKSGMIKQVYRFFPSQYVAVLSANMEIKFGLDSIHDKFLCVCYELRANMGWNQAEFQSMVSGEDMSIASKYKKAIHGPWKVPLILAGNQIPNFVDAAGSVLRRLLIFRFDKRVANPDPTMDAQLREEAPAFLFKTNRAYCFAVRRYGHEYEWKWLPNKLMENRLKIAATLSPLQSFLENCDRLVRAPEYYMPLDKFQQLYSTFKDMQKLKGGNWTDEYVNPILEENGLEIQRMESHMYEGEMKVRTWIMGVDLREHVERQHPNPNPNPS